MALVRHDAVAPPLLAQAARAAEGTPAAGPLMAAATAMRVAPALEPVRRVALSLCRMGVHEAEAEVLGPRR